MERVEKDFGGKLCWGTYFENDRGNNVFFRMASKPIKIRWIRTGSHPYLKIMYSIVLQTISHEY